MPMPAPLITVHWPAAPPAGARFAADGDEAWRAARRVLAVRLDGLGDLLMTTPALAAVRNGLAAGGRLTLLTSPAGAAAAECLPFVDSVIAFDAPWVKSAATPSCRPPGEIGDDEARLIAELKARAFDAAVVFTVCTQSALPAALLLRLAGIPLRLAHARENPYALLSDWRPEPAQPHHEVERQLALVRSVGWSVDDDRLRLRCTEQHQQAAAAALQGAGLPAGAAYFVVHPGASAASRRWPAGRFGAAAALIAGRSGLAPVFCGSAAEQPLVDEARAAAGVPSFMLPPPLGVGALAAAIGGARLLLANNSGPAHIAAATATPAVVLYALTNPQHTPWRAAARVLSHEVPCRNCLKSDCPEGHHDCLRQVSPLAAADAAAELLQENG